MLINVLDHDMVPNHEVMSKQEQEELLEKLNITKEKLPKILDSDAVLKDMKVKAGDVIKITRTSHMSEEIPYYRIVVAL